MPLRINYEHVPAVYSVRYAETKESIIRTTGWKKSRHRYWGIDVGVAGVAVRVNDQVYRRGRNTVGIYAPGIRYEEKMETGSLVSWAWLLVHEEARPSLLSRLAGEKGFCFLDDPMQLVRKQIKLLVEAAQTRGPQRNFFLTAYLHQIIGTLFSLESAPGAPLPPKSKARYAWVHPWRRAVWKGLERDGAISPAAIAADLDVSLSTLTHQYRKNCGETLHETINCWRLEKAQALLSGGELSIKQVAGRVGLSHQSYLSHLFQAQLGLSPSQYQRLSESRIAENRK